MSPLPHHPEVHPPASLNQGLCVGHPHPQWWSQPRTQRLKWSQERWDGGGNLTALDLCHRCPVEADCLDHALRAESVALRHQGVRDGIWGGTTPLQRHTMSQVSA